MNRRQELATTFHRALTTGDLALLRGIMAPDVSWRLPGSNRVSGRVDGVDAVLAHVELIASYGVDFALEHVLESPENFALALHNTARRGELVLDEHLATVCTVQDGRISAIETYLSDVQGMDAFFAELP